MSVLEPDVRVMSRNMGRWLQSNPGPIYGRTADEARSAARVQFCIACRVKNADSACPQWLFDELLDMRGYRPEIREDHSKTLGDNGHRYFMIQLPAQHTGF